MVDRTISHAERLRHIERLLFGNLEGMRAVEIAHAMGVDRRTVYRDIETLSRSGVPIWQEAGRFGVQQQAYAATVRLNVHEALALFLAAHTSSAHLSAYNAILAASLAKLAAAFPEPVSALVEHSANTLEQRVADGGDPVTLEIIARAWASLRLARLWRRGRQHDAAVYFLSPSEIGGIYVLGADARTGKRFALSLAGIQRAQLLDERYTLPFDFDPEHHLSQAWQAALDDLAIEVVLEFMPTVAPAIRARRWHPSQQIEEMEGGGVRLTMRVDDLREIHAWLLSWGPEARVLAPPALREEIASLALRLASAYG